MEKTYEVRLGRRGFSSSTVITVRADSEFNAIEKAKRQSTLKDLPDVEVQSVKEK